MNEDTPAEAEARHQEFVESAVANDVVWGLMQGSGWANWRTDEDENVFPLWSDRAQAKKCAEVTFKGYQPKCIELHTLIEDILPRIADSGCWVGTNLTEEMTGIDLPVSELLRKLGVT